MATTLSAGADDGSSQDAPAPLTVLVVEDDLANGYVFTKFVQKLGHASTLATSGVAALELLSKARYDVVLMDIEMPGMDGLEAVRRLRAGAAGEQNAATPVFALTAHSAWEGYEAKCREAGMDGLLSKPLELGVLGQVLRDVAGRGHKPDRSDASSPAPDEILYDKSFALTRFDGDEQLFESFLAIVRQRYGQGLPELVRAAGQEDLAPFTRLAHSVKSVFSQLGAGRCRALAEALERAGHAGDRATISELVPRLERELATLMHVL